CVLANKLCRLAIGQVKDVVEDQHLAIAIWSRADADSRALYLLGDNSCDLPRNPLQHDREDARAVQSDCIFHQPFDSAKALALHAISAHDMHRLRGESDVSHNGNLGIEQPMDESHALIAAFDLHRFSSAVFE